MSNFYGLFKMIILCYLRLNHYGKVCSGDYIRYPTYIGYDKDQLTFYKKAAEFEQGKYLYAMVLIAFVFLFMATHHLIPIIVK